MEFPVIQFMRPNGRRKELIFDVPPDSEQLVIEAQKRGYTHLEGEVLTTGEVSITLNKDIQEDGEIGPELVAAEDNRPGDDSVDQACIRLFKQAAADAAKGR